MNWTLSKWLKRLIISSVRWTFGPVLSGLSGRKNSRISSKRLLFTFVYWRRHVSKICLGILLKSWRFADVFLLNFRQLFQRRNGLKVFKRSIFSGGLHFLQFEPNLGQLVFNIGSFLSENFNFFVLGFKFNLKTFFLSCHKVLLFKMHFYLFVHPFRLFVVSIIVFL